MRELSKRSLDTLRLFREMNSVGLFPPLMVVADSTEGNVVQATKTLPTHSFIAEYLGDVNTVDVFEASENATSVDSFMTLLNTGTPETSLLINANRSSNIARYIR